MRAYSTYYDPLILEAAQDSVEHDLKYIYDPETFITYEIKTTFYHKEPANPKADNPNDFFGYTDHEYELINTETNEILSPVPPHLQKLMANHYG